MILKDDKKGYASIILKRMKGIPGYEDMKSKNEDKMEPALYGKKEPEYEEKEMTASSEDGMDRAAENIIEAINIKDPNRLKMHLKALMKMQIHEDK